MARSAWPRRHLQHPADSAFGAAALGLLIGGVAAAPLGSYVAKRVPARLMMIMVGLVLSLTSLLGPWLAMK